MKRLSHPRTLSLEILPRRPSAAGTYDKRSYPLDSPELRHDDTFRLRLSAFGDTFHLHLRPNEHLIHPAARISYYTTDADGRSVLDRTEPLLPQSVKAYWGEVVEEDASEGRMREDAAGVWPRPAGKFERGWARIVVHHQGDPAAGLPPSFEGAFSVDGVVHHVMTQDNYLRTKLTLDPHILSDDPDSSLVIFRDSDVMTPYEYRVVGSALDTSFADPPSRTCAHDKLDFNTNPLVNPVLRRPPPVTPWYDPFHFLRNANSTLARRDDVAGGGYTTKSVTVSLILRSLVHIMMQLRGQHRPVGRLPQHTESGLHGRCGRLRVHQSVRLDAECLTTDHLDVQYRKRAVQVDVQRQSRDHRAPGARPHVSHLLLNVLAELSVIYLA